MSLLGIIKGHNYNKKILRREKTGNGRYRNVWDKAAEIEDKETGEKKLKLKKDGLEVPKPEDQQFETLWYKTWFDKLTFDKSHAEYLEIYLEDKDGNGDWIQFEPDDNDLVFAGAENQFQTHRDIENEKTLEIYETEDNQKWWFLATAGALIVIQLGGMYIITSGMQQAIIKGIKNGFETVAKQQNLVKGAVTSTVLIASFSKQKTGEVVKSWI